MFGTLTHTNNVLPFSRRSIAYRTAVFQEDKVISFSIFAQDKEKKISSRSRKLAGLSRNSTHKHLNQAHLIIHIQLLDGRTH